MMKRSRPRVRSSSPSSKHSDNESAPCDPDSSADPNKRRRRASPASQRPANTSSLVVARAAWEPECGTIAKVELSDFLCHGHLVYMPRPGLNFLSGVNGSGKSAVLSAVLFALGGAAREARKGAPNKSLVRHGALRATAKVTLHNVGEMSYRPQTFGKQITVVRSVSKGGGGAGYKLLDTAGKIVTSFRSGCTTPKQELEQILSHFMIQVHNPLTLLPQDLAKAFLAECNPLQMYKFYQQATQLDECLKAIENTLEEIQRSTKIFEEKKVSLTGLEKERNEWDKKREYHASLEDQRTRLIKNQRELQWSLVARAEEAWRQSAKEKNVVQEKVTACDNHIKEAEEKQRENTEAQNRVRQQLDELQASQGTLNFEEQKRELGRKREAAAEAKRKFQQRNDKQEQAESDIDRLRQNFEKLKSQKNEHEEERRRVEAEISELETNVREAEAKLAAHKTHRANTENDLHSDPAYEEARNEQLAQKSKLESQVRGLEQLRKEEGNKISHFGDKMVQLVDEIRRHEREFKHLPTGPLGAEIQLDPKATPEQAALIEGELRNKLTAFIVDNFADQKLLNRLQAKLRSNFQVIVMQYRFGAKKYDISQGRCRTSYPCIVDLLVMRPLVHNCLLDQGGIERILLIPDDIAAQELLKSESTAPRNCSYALTNSFQQVYPAPSYRSYALKKVQQRILHQSFADLIEAREAEIASLQDGLRAADDRLSAARAAKQEKEKALQREKQQCNKQENLVKKLYTRMSKLKNKVEASKTPDFEVLEDDIQRKVDEKDELRCKVAEAKEACDEAEKVFQAESEKLRNLKRLYNEQQEQRLPLEEELEELKGSVMEYQASRDKLRSSKERLLNRLREAEEKEKAQAAKAQKLRATVLEQEKRHGIAFEPGERVRAPEKIQKEINNLNDHLRNQEKDVEDFDTVMDQLNKYTERYREGRFMLNANKRHREELHRMFRRRRESYKTIRNSLTRRIQTRFSVNMERRKFAGCVEIDHAEKKLILDIRPMDSDSLPRRDLRTLSGGEKSFATISLILSLWECMEPPFRILDEFDVFMDMINRDIALQQIINYAKESRRFQYIFLTPLNTDQLAKDKDCYVVKLQKKAGD